MNSFSDDANGFITHEYKYLPVSSRHASLHPLVYPGSNASTLLFLIGGCKSKLSKFLPKFSIAVSPAFSLSSLLISLSIDGPINLA